MAYQLKDANDQPVKYQGQDVFAHDQTGSVKAVNKENRTLVIVGTDESKDRDGDIITVKGWQMENFLKNPVFLYAHNYSSVPIGSATKVIKRKDPARLEFHEKFPTEGLYPFADMIFELFNEKILNASSVGFIAIEHEPLEKDADSNEMFSRGRRYLKQELLELSACPVPSNPNALQNSIKFMKSHTADDIALMMAGQTDLNLQKDEVISELKAKETEFIDENEIKSFVPKNYTIEKEEEFITAKGEFEGVKEEIDEMKKEIESIEEKTGATLSSKNKKRLSDALDLIKQVIDEATKPEEQNEEAEKEVTINDVMDQINIIVSDIDSIKEYIDQTQSKDNGDEDIVEEKDSLQDEYEKILSQDDHKDHEVEDDNISDEEIIKQIVLTLKEKLEKKE
jgi:hypothetical protein